MTPPISNEDEAKLIELRYGLADLILTCQQFSDQTSDDAIGIANLLKAAETQVALLLHLQEVKAFTNRPVRLQAVAA